MQRVHATVISCLKMARFQQNIRKVSEKKMGRDTNSPVAANGFCTVSEPNCVRLSWIDHTGAGHTINSAPGTPTPHDAVISVTE